MQEGLSSPPNPGHLHRDTSDEWGAEARHQHGVTKIDSGNGEPEEGVVRWDGKCSEGEAEGRGGAEGGSGGRCGGSGPVEVRPTALRRERRGLKSMCC